MTDWIDFSVYAAVNAFFWFVMPAGISRTGLLWAMDRNPRWLSEHPQTAAKLNDNRRYLWTCYVLGTLCLAALAACQLGFWPQALSAPAPEHWRVLKDVNSATVLVAVAFYCVSTFFSVACRATCRSRISAKRRSSRARSMISCRDYSASQPTR